MSHVFHFCHIILETSTSTVDDRSGVGGTKRGNTELKLQKKKKMTADNLRRKFSIMYYKLKIRVSSAIQKIKKIKK